MNTELANSNFPLILPRSLADVLTETRAGTLAICVLAITLSACTSKEGPPSKKLVATATSLQQIIQAAPKSVIDLHKLQGDHLKPSLVFGDESRDGSAVKGNLYLAQPTETVVIGDSIYISDRLNNAVIVSNKSGRLVRRIGRIGQAPTEFRNPWQICMNDRFVFVFDEGNARIQVFDRAFNYLTSIPSSFVPLFGSIAANSHSLFTPANIGDSVALRIYQSREPFKLLTALMPLVVPVGQQPMIMNQITVATNTYGDYVVGYSCLPYLFLFNSRNEQLTTIEFKGEEVEHLDAPPPDKLRMSGNAAPARRFIFGLAILDNRTIYLVTGKSILYVLEPRGNQQYGVRRMLRLDTDGAMIWDLNIDGAQLYVTLMHNPKVMRFDL